MYNTSVERKQNPAVGGLMSMGGVKEVTAMWLSAKQVRALTGLERHQVDWWRKSGKVQARKWQRMWLYNVADVYRISEQAREALAELSRFVERTENGKHFTEAFRYWRELEAADLIEVERPKHPATGLQYDEQYYRATLTFEGAQLANLIEELRADE
jgi:hypothetical protein